MWDFRSGRGKTTMVGTRNKLYFVYTQSHRFKTLCPKTGAADIIYKPLGKIINIYTQSIRLFDSSHANISLIYIYISTRPTWNNILKDIVANRSYIVYTYIYITYNTQIVSVSAYTYYNCEQCTQTNFAKL